MPEAWIPTRVEALQRNCQQRWMQELGFSNKLLDSIMMEDMPEFHVVRRLIETYGTDEARRRLERFLWE